MSGTRCKKSIASQSVVPAAGFFLVFLGVSLGSVDTASAMLRTSSNVALHRRFEHV
jgi:hypothetical protein